MRPPYSEQLIELTEKIDMIVRGSEGKDLADWSMIDELKDNLDDVLCACACRPLIDKFDKLFISIYKDAKNIDEAFNRAVDEVVHDLVREPYWLEKARRSYEPDLKYVYAASVYVMLAGDDQSDWGENLELFNHAAITYEPIVTRMRRFRPIIIQRTQARPRNAGRNL
jgi:hypothetical protein